jgi:DNA-binding NtrC family response regulator
MRAVDLDLRELLDFGPQGGILRFAGQRALLFDAVALGLLRRELIQTIGHTAARGVLTRFGYAHGWRMAEVLRSEFPWENEHEWRIAGGRLHRLLGLVLFEPVTMGGPQRAPQTPPGTMGGPQRAPQTPPGTMGGPAAQTPSGTIGEGRPPPFAEAIWHESYEAEQHLLHVGQSDEPVCWTLCGFASGYLSCCNGHEILCVEERCAGKGDALCTMVGRPREEWGPDQAPRFAYFERECMEVALKRVTGALRRAERRLKSRESELGVGEDEIAAGVIARSAAMRKVVDLARRVAKVDSTALITGESGVGKEVVARLIHAESDRLGHAFVAINCGAVPEGLLESELFGHARGAFTGATQDRTGLFEAANEGTLFLDEVGDVPPSMQVKLLRVLQEREVRRVGENRPRAVDVRVLAATNRDLAADVASGAFRQDLYYRLRVIELKVPALRDRSDDILPLARSFLARVARRLGRDVTGFTPTAANLLCRHSWPGNVRELENAVERAVVLARGSRVDVDDLPEEVSAAPPRTAKGAARTLAEVEREHILAVLEASGGNKAKASERLGIGAATLFRKLREYREEPS